MAQSGRPTAPRGRASETAVRLAELFRHVAIIGIAGALVGLIVGGIGGRVLMRIAAIVAPDAATGALTENGNAIGEITVGGTIELLVFVGILFGGIGAVVYVVSERWLAWAGPARPLGFALLLFAVGSPIALDPHNVDFLLVENYRLIVALFGALFLLYGALVPMLADGLEKLLPKVDPARPIESAAMYLSLTTLGGMFVLLLMFVAIEENDPAIYLLFGLGLATGLGWWLDVQPAARLWPGVPRVLGYGSLMGAAVAGTCQTWTAIADILAGDIR